MKVISGKHPSKAKRMEELMEIILGLFLGWPLTIAIIVGLCLLFILCGHFFGPKLTDKERASFVRFPSSPPQEMGQMTSCDMHSDRPAVARVCCKLGKNRYRWYDMCAECHEAHKERRYREMEKLDTDNAN